jgi:gluconate 2-dehydrogenase
MRTLYHQRTQLSQAEEHALQVEYASLEALLSQADWVVPQLPSGPATKHFLNSRNLAHIKHGAIIANVSRADIIERQALLDSLRSERIRGFGLDPQYETPGRDDDELLGMSNVILTPHIAAQPRFNALKDFADLIGTLSRETQR